MSCVWMESDFPTLWQLGRGPGTHIVKGFMDTNLSKIDFSIALPIYNVSPYLGRCLDSVRRAVDMYNGPEKHEILLVLDKPTDGSDLIAEEFARRNGDVRLLYHADNRGVAQARNTALSVARGEYMIWVDSDDSVEPDWFSSIVSAIRCSHADVIAFDFYKAYSDGRMVANHYGIDRFGAEFEGGEVSSALWVGDVLRSIRTFAFPWTKVFRRELFLPNGFDAPRGALEDMGAMLDVADKVNRIYYIPRCLYGYFVNESGLVATLSPERRICHVKYAYPKIKKLSWRYRCAASVGCFQLLFDIVRCSLMNKRADSDPMFNLALAYMKRLILFCLFDIGLNYKIKVVYFLSSIRLAHPLLRRVWS